MTNDISEGYKTTGFFGFFDVLGYRRMIGNEKNNLDEIIKIYNDLLLHLPITAELFTDKPLGYSYSSFKPLAFSDTIILYHYVNEKSTPNMIKLFISTSSCLLRLAFDRGIPLRGAISYGTYFIRENPLCFLGKPIVEAYDSEKKNKIGPGQFSASLLPRKSFRIYQIEVSFH